MRDACKGWPGLFLNVWDILRHMHPVGTCMAPPSHANTCYLNMHWDTAQTYNTNCVLGTCHMYTTDHIDHRCHGCTVGTHLTQHPVNTQGVRAHTHTAHIVPRLPMRAQDCRTLPMSLHGPASSLTATLTILSLQTGFLIPNYFSQCRTIMPLQHLCYNCRESSGVC